MVIFFSSFRFREDCTAFQIGENHPRIGRDLFFRRFNWLTMYLYDSATIIPEDFFEKLRHPVEWIRPTLTITNHDDSRDRGREKACESHLPGESKGWNSVLWMVLIRKHEVRLLHFCYVLVQFFGFILSFDGSPTSPELQGDEVW